MKHFTLLILLCWISNIIYGQQKISKSTVVDGKIREYFIHIPASFDSTKPTPMVMFFHGGGHDGELMYNISGWNDVADTANIIMVYPSALKYCVIEDGQQKFMSQWNNGHSGNTFCPNQALKDDVLFIKTIFQQMSSKFNIDSKRIYTVGFSNGGEFAATRTAIELSDIIAASISCGGGGSLPRDSVLLPKRKLPVMLMFGNKDERLLKAVNVNDAVPMGFNKLYNSYPVLYYAQVKPYVNSFGLDESNYKIIGDTNNVVVAIFKGLSNKPENIFYNVEVKGLEHEYPNGKNHGLHGATYHWRWLRQYTLDGLLSSVENEYSKSQIFFYPNPASNYVRFSEEVKYRIIDLGGKLLKQGYSVEVSLDGLDNGLYIIEVGNSKSKLVVVK